MVRPSPRMMRAALGRAGKKVVHERYSDTAMAEATLELYRRYTGTLSFSAPNEAD